MDECCAADGACAADEEWVCAAADEEWVCAAADEGWVQGECETWLADEAGKVLAPMSRREYDGGPCANDADSL